MINPTYHNDKDLEFVVEGHDLLGNEMFEKQTYYYKLGQNVRYVVPQFDEYYIEDNWLENEEKEYIINNKHTIPNYYGYNEKTLEEFKKGLDILRKACIYAQRIDWLLSGDDGEESFHKRLKEDLEKYYSKIK